MTCVTSQLPNKIHKQYAGKCHCFSDILDSQSKLGSIDGLKMSLSLDSIVIQSISWSLDRGPTPGFKSVTPM